MGVEIRVPREDELRPVLTAAETAFGGELREIEFERAEKTLGLDRFLGAFDDGRPVGAAGAYRFELTVPGGTAPAAGVTWIGVLPSHRRRGILTEFMRRQLADFREHREPLAVLWASEGSIYGRFGYGLATLGARVSADSDRLRFRDDPGPSGSVRLLEPGEATSVLGGIYDAIRRRTPGMLRRSDDWWRLHRLSDDKEERGGAGPKRCAVLDLDGAPAGYAVYRVKSNWEGGVPSGTVNVTEMMASSPVAARELWRFLLSIDLTVCVDAWNVDPDAPLVLMFTEPRRLKLSLGDGLWLRVIDVERALRARSWPSGSVVLDVRDEFCPWNRGLWRAGVDAGRTDAEPELALDVADLASLYLGGFSFAQLARAGRVEELRPGALGRADLLFRADRLPWCPEVF